MRPVTDSASIAVVCLTPLSESQDFFGRAIGNPDFDWNFATVPQAALDGSVRAQPRGKMLGGSSGLNFMAWDRASAEEYDAWEQVCLAWLSLFKIGMVFLYPL